MTKNTDENGLLPGILAMSSTDDGIVHVSKDSNEDHAFWSKVFDALESLLPIAKIGERFDLTIDAYTISAVVLQPGRAVFVATEIGHPVRKSLHRWAKRMVARRDREAEKAAALETFDEKRKFASGAAQ